MRLPSAINGHYYCGWVQSGDNPLKELLTWSIWQDRQHNVMGAQTDKFWQQIQLVRVKHFPHLPLSDPSSRRPKKDLTLWTDSPAWRCSALRPRQSRTQRITIWRPEFFGGVTGKQWYEVEPFCQWQEFSVFPLKLQTANDR